MLRGHTAPVSAVAFGLDRKGLHVASFALHHGPATANNKAEFRCWHPAAASGHCLCAVPSDHDSDWKQLELRWTSADTVSLRHAATAAGDDGGSTADDGGNTRLIESYAIPRLDGAAGSPSGSPRLDRLPLSPPGLPP